MMPRQVISTLADILKFGKYRGKTVAEVIDLDPSYILWMHDEGGFVINEPVYELACVADANNLPPEDFFWQPG